MLLEFNDTCLFLTTTREIWEKIRQAYFKMTDAAQSYELKMKIPFSKQGTRSVIEYYNIIKNLWQEIDYYLQIRMKCTKDTMMLQKFVERERTIDFLVGLNVEFDQVQVQILGKEELPSINEVFPIIQVER